MKNISSRLKNLEKALNKGRRDVLLVLPKSGESNEEAVKRVRKKTGVNDEKLLLILSIRRDGQKQDIDILIENEKQRLRDEGFTENEIRDACKA